MKKIILVAMIMLATVAAAEQMTLTGTLKFSPPRAYYFLEGCTPELVAGIKGDQFGTVDMQPFEPGDEVSIVIDGAHIRPDGKLSTWGATVISVDKVQ
jgi:hypothetical protein